MIKGKRNGQWSPDILWSLPVADQVSVKAGKTLTVCINSHLPDINEISD